MSFWTLDNGLVRLGKLAPETRFSIGSTRGRVVAQHTRNGKPDATLVKIHVRSGHYVKTTEWSPHIAVEVEG